MSTTCAGCGEPILQKQRGRPRLRHPECPPDPLRVPRKQYVWPAHHVAIVTAWRSGRTATALAGEFGISRERVRQIIRRAGYPSARHLKTPRIETCRVCRQEYVDGTYPAHVRAALHGFGVGPRPGPSGKTVAMARAYADGGNTREIAETFGVSPMMVYAAAQRVYGSLRYHQQGRIGPRTPARRLAVEMLRNGVANWVIAKETGLKPGDITHLKSRYLGKAA